MIYKKILLLLFIFQSFLQAQERQSIGIITCQVPGQHCWDPNSIKSGITGSEEAVIYMADSLAKLGYDVTVLGNPPKDSAYTTLESNPRYLNLNEEKIHQFDIAIAWRIPRAAAWLKKLAPLVYLWPHDTCNTVLSEKEISGFNDVLWLSEWQRKQWISLNPSFASFCHIFGNGIVEEQFSALQKKENPYSCIYGSNYGRGLDILLDIWPGIKHQYPQATLDIYYGWQHWGLLTKEKEASMKKQIQRLYRLDVKEHGLVSHEELNRAYEKASFWTYPCTAPETFCITALRAQMSGAIPVIIQGSALPETVRYGYFCTTKEKYVHTLLQAMSQVHEWNEQKRKEMRVFIQNEYTWKQIANKWHDLFQQNAKNLKSLQTAS